MNKTLGIATIALVAVVMGMSVISTAIPVANAAPLSCPSNLFLPNGSWFLVDKRSHPQGDAIDQNGDGLICQFVIQTNHGTIFGGLVDNRF